MNNMDIDITIDIIDKYLDIKIIDIDVRDYRSQITIRSVIQPLLKENKTKQKNFKNVIIN